MDALRYDPDSLKFGLDQIPVPEIVTKDSVKIEVKYAGMCGTDLHIMMNEFANGCTSTNTLGHEFCGEVVDVGEEAAKVSGIKVGDRVGVDPNQGCFSCDFCQKGKVHFCQPRGVHFASGVHKDGGFAKYAIAHHGQLSKLPEGLSYQHGALCEPLSCLLHGWDRLNKLAELDSSSKILVLGAGIIGNLWLSLLHFKGFRDVIISEPSKARRDISEGMGLGYRVVSPTELETLMPQTALEADTSGVEVIIDCTGYPPALESAIKWTRRGATVCIFGCAPPGKTMEIKPEEVFNKELIIFGTLVNPHTYGRATGLAKAMGEKYLSYSKLGIRTYTLQEYEKALEALKNAEISKAVFKL